MRLKDFEVQAIKDAVNSMDRDAVVYLFGSRVDDNKRGGDIDLIIISSKLILEISIKFIQRSQKHLKSRKLIS